MFNLEKGRNIKQIDSNNSDYNKNLQQEPIFSKYCYGNLDEYTDSFDVLSNITMPNFFIVAAAAQCENGIDHLLDGYSWVNIVRVKDGQIDVQTLKIQEDEDLRIQELNGIQKFGLFVSKKLPWWRKLLFGRIPQLLYDGRAIQRETPHQPIYYPKLNQLSISSLIRWPTFNINWDSDSSQLATRSESFIRDNIPASHYLCTHPHFDYEKQEVLTFSYLHSKFSRKTTLWLYAFGNDSNHDNGKDSNIKEPIKYVVNDRLILHMFGFTENYFIIFATALYLQKGGQTALNCGSPILREIDDDSCGEIFLHFIPRDVNNKDLKPFNINTKQQGFVYHSINCFEENGKIIIDAYVSKLNPSREASQFELSKNHSVYDNEGDPFRFVVSENKNVISKLISSSLDTAIDFHSINPKKYGKKYKDWFMVSYDRQRDLDGKIVSVVSTLSAFTIDYPSNSPLEFDSNNTVSHKITSKSWSNSKVVYLRTPLYVPGNNDNSDDRLVCWSYESNEEDNDLNAYLLFFNTKLELLQKIEMVEKVPYSIHSWGIYE